MDETKLENIDIEKNKELFEYEMTEVILKLKGEFAVVSGRNTRYAEAAVDEERLKVSPVTLTQVEMQENTVTVPETSAGLPSDISRIELKEAEIDYPEKLQVNIPGVVNAEEFRPIDLELPEIPLVSSVKKAVEVSGQNEPLKINLPSNELRSFRPASLPDVELQKTSFEVPDVSEKVVFEVEKIDSAAPSITIPKVSEIQQKEPFKAGFEAKEVAVPKLSQPVFPDIEAGKTADVSVSIPETEVSNVLSAEIGQIEVAAADTKLPEQKEIGNIKMDIAVSVADTKIDVPQVSEKVSFESISENTTVSGELNTVHLPEQMKVSLPEKETEWTPELQKITLEIPEITVFDGTVQSLNIEKKDAAVEAIMNMDPVEKPDVSGFIDEIISTLKKEM